LAHEVQGLRAPRVVNVRGDEQGIRRGKRPMQSEEASHACWRGRKVSSCDTRRGREYRPRALPYLQEYNAAMNFCVGRCQLE
jgi:hypothetical protein